MATASQNVWEEIWEALLTCKICEEPFDQQERLPRVLPCQHTFCGPCITQLNKGGKLSCPNCRRKIRAAETFQVEPTRSALLDCTEVIQTAQGALCEGCDDGTKATYRCLDCAQTFCEECCRYHKKFKAFRDHVLVSLEEAANSPYRLLRKVEMWLRNQDKKPEFYCKTCKRAVSSSGVVSFHQHRDGHALMELCEILEQAKRQIESHSGNFNNIRESSLHLQAKMAATSLQKTDVSFKTAEWKIEDVFSKAVNALLDRKSQAVEELRSKWTSEGGKPLQSLLCYEVNTDLSGLMRCLQDLGSVQTVAVTSRSISVPNASSVTSSPILTPEFQLEPDRCNAGCRLKKDGKKLMNTPRPQFPITRRFGPRPFAFLGTCGSVDLAQPALHYWTVTWWTEYVGSGDRCEFGLASLQTLVTCDEGQRISDHDDNSATLVVVRNESRQRLVGRNWTEDLDTPPPPQGCDVTYTCLWEEETGYRLDMTLGFLYDNRQPQSPRVLVVETESCRLLGVRRLSPSPDFRPVLRIGPSSNGWGADALLEVKTGPGILNIVTAVKLQSLVRQTDVSM